MNNAYWSLVNQELQQDRNIPPVTVLAKQQDQSLTVANYQTNEPNKTNVTAKGQSPRRSPPSKPSSQTATSPIRFQNVRWQQDPALSSSSSSCEDSSSSSSSSSSSGKDSSSSSSSSSSSDEDSLSSNLLQNIRRRLFYALKAQDNNWQSFFHVYDTNNDGVLSLQEFRQALCDKNSCDLSNTLLPNATIRVLFNHIDVDGSGGIDALEFCTWLYADNGSGSGNESQIGNGTIMNLGLSSLVLPAATDDCWEQSNIPPVTVLAKQQDQSLTVANYQTNEPNKTNVTAKGQSPRRSPPSKPSSQTATSPIRFQNVRWQHSTIRNRTPISAHSPSSPFSSLTSFSSPKSTTTNNNNITTTTTTTTRKNIDQNQGLLLLQNVDIKLQEIKLYQSQTKPSSRAIQHRNNNNNNNNNDNNNNSSNDVKSTPSTVWWTKTNSQTNEPTKTNITAKRQSPRRSPPPSHDIKTKTHDQTESSSKSPTYRCPPSSLAPSFLSDINSRQSRRIAACFGHLGLLSLRGAEDLSKELYRHAADSQSIRHYGFQTAIRNIYKGYIIKNSRIDTLWSLLDSNRTGKIFIPDLCQWLLNKLSNPVAPLKSPERIANTSTSELTRRTEWKNKVYKKINNNTPGTLHGHQKTSPIMMSKIQQRVLSKRKGSVNKEKEVLLQQEQGDSTVVTEDIFQLHEQRHRDRMELKQNLTDFVQGVNLTFPVRGL